MGILSLKLYNIRSDFSEHSLCSILGETGKYYCGRRLISCQCCDGVCGPNDGCNCTSCSQLDIEDKNHYDKSSAAAGRSGKSSQHIINSWTWKQKIGTLV